jgi:hypothetical protein
MCLWITEHLITYSSINTGRKEPNDDDFLTGSNLISLRHWDIELSQRITVNGETEMSDTKERIRRTGILQIVMLLVVVASVNAGGIMDAARLITEQLWEHRYIPDSGLPTVPLSEYEEFDVVELFRAETTQDIEAAISDGYPMPWLEEILKDESIPWEDRYWLDCRVRGFIAENLHIFFREDGAAREVPCDWMSAGEKYWRETFIVNLVGDAPETLTEDMPRTYRESGVLVDLYGVKIGSIAIADSLVRLSRLGVAITGWRYAGRPETFDEEAYFCLLYPDGSFLEIPYEEQYQPSGSQYNVSQDGSMAVLAVSDHSGDNQLRIFNENGELLSRLPMEGKLEVRSYPVISPDNMFIAVALDVTEGSIGELIEVASGSTVFDSWMAARFPQFSANSERVSFCGQEEPISVLSTTGSRILNEYSQSDFFTTVGEKAFCDFVHGATICNTDNLVLVSWDNYSVDTREVDLLFNSTVQGRYPDYNEGTFSPNGNFVWLADVLEGQGSTRSFYGSKSLVLGLEGVER